MRSTIALTASTAWYLYNYRRGLIRELLNRECQVVSYVPDGTYSHRLSQLGVKGVPISMSQYGVDDGEMNVVAEEYRRSFLELKVGILLTFTIKPNILASVAASALDIPVIATVPGLGMAFLFEGEMKRRAIELYRKSFVGVRRVFFQNVNDFDSFVGWGIISHQAGEVVGGSGVDLEYFRFLPKINDSRAHKCRFLYFGRIMRPKGIVEFGRAARIVAAQRPHASFVVAGSHEAWGLNTITEEEFRDCVSLNQSVEYLGHVEDVRGLIEAADCVVLPSYYPEGAPHSLLQSAAIGRPIITTETPGCRRTIEPGVSGLICKAGDVGSLVRAMLKMNDMGAEARNIMGIAGRRKIEAEFDERSVIARYVEAIDMAISK